MFKHKHPYAPFIQNNSTKLIVGTLPPPRFTTRDLKVDDVNFCYGSRNGKLWKIIDAIYNLNLRYDNSQEAIEERKQFLIKQKIGICDIVESAEREKVNASDLGMKHIKLRDVIGYLKQYPSIETLLFTGGNSKNGPEYFFRKHIKDYNIKLELVSKEVPRIHQFTLCHSERNEESNYEIPQSPNFYKNDKRIIKTVSLTSGSGAANISIGSMPLYKQLKAKNPKFNTFDFRVMQYRDFF